MGGLAHEAAHRAVGPGQPSFRLVARPDNDTPETEQLDFSSGSRPPPGLAPSSRPDNHSTSEALTPTTPTSSSQNRMGGAPSVNIISGLASGPGMDHMKGGLAGLLGPPPKAPRGRKKIKAENTSGPLLVVPYPILADQGCVTVAPKEGKTYRLGI